MSSRSTITDQHVFVGCATGDQVKRLQRRLPLQQLPIDAAAIGRQVAGHRQRPASSDRHFRRSLKRMVADRRALLDRVLGDRQLIPLLLLDRHLRDDRADATVGSGGHPGIGRLTPMLALMPPGPMLTPPLMPIPPTLIPPPMLPPIPPGRY